MEAALTVIPDWDQGPPLDIPSFGGFLTGGGGGWTVTRSSLRKMLRVVATCSALHLLTSSLTGPWTVTRISCRTMSWFLVACSAVGPVHIVLLACERCPIAGSLGWRLVLPF